MDESKAALERNRNGIFRGLLTGAHERGEGGFLYVTESDACAYLFPHELAADDDPRVGEVRAWLQDAIPGAPDVFFVATRAGERLHVVAYPKATVFAAATRSP